LREKYEKGKKKKGKLGKKMKEMGNARKKKLGKSSEIKAKGAKVKTNRKCDGLKFEYHRRRKNTVCSGGRGVIYGFRNDL
jgi:hypothetical protein